ncbi:unnamed protein product [Rotaria sp. Silwood1]|nr:unnamed protein product [Rotaria sp. Silwood1]CAF3818951.1 unnamed protein product [Rotaria sp. Silwood1]CAF4788295.1 unnamed protein product [Rotaria sp. Silwood1]CAF4811801.1 unnamed protein product [Rotaria sp. Silwood1]
MGEGKTSVILSILREILANGKQTVRINCLESLMGNMQELLRNKFSVTPEQRLCFQLKKQKMFLEYLQSKDADDHFDWDEHHHRAYTSTVKSRDPYDILDESDEILCHGKKLNYTLGSPKPLDGGPTRWRLPFLFFNMIFNEKQFCEKLKVASQLNNSPVIFQENFRPISGIGGGSSFVRFCKI